MEKMLRPEDEGKEEERAIDESEEQALIVKLATALSQGSNSRIELVHSIATKLSKKAGRTPLSSDITHLAQAGTPLPKEGKLDVGTSVVLKKGIEEKGDLKRFEVAKVTYSGWTGRFFSLIRQRDGHNINMWDKKQDKNAIERKDLALAVENNTEHAIFLIHWAADSGCNWGVLNIILKINEEVAATPNRDGLSPLSIYISNVSLHFEWFNYIEDFFLT